MKYFTRTSFLKIFKENKLRRSWCQSQYEVAKAARSLLMLRHSQNDDLDDLDDDNNDLNEALKRTLAKRKKISKY